MTENIHNKSHKQNIKIGFGNLVDTPAIYRIVEQSNYYSPELRRTCLTKKDVFSRVMRLRAPYLFYFLESFFLQEKQKKLFSVSNLPIYFVAKKDDAVIGECGIVYNGILNEWRLFSLSVLPCCRHIGLGKLLLYGAINYLRNIHAQAVYLGVPDANHIAIRLYSSLGFIMVSKHKAAYGNTQLITMRLSLNDDAN